MNEIWLVDDNENSISVVKHAVDGLCRLKSFTTIPSFFEALSSAKPDLIVTEINVAGENFLDLMGTANDHLRGTKIIILSTRDGEHDFNLSFQLGALDYLTKPFNPNELRFKIRRQLTQSHLKGLTIDPIRFIIYRQDNSEVFAHLTPKEFQIFNMIYNSPNQSITKATIQKVCWSNKDALANTFDVHLYNLRRKLEAIGLRLRYIGRKGYSLQFEE